MLIFEYSPDLDRVIILFFRPINQPIRWNSPDLDRVIFFFAHKSAYRAKFITWSWFWMRNLLPDYHTKNRVGTGQLKGVPGSESKTRGRLVSPAKAGKKKIWTPYQNTSKSPQSSFFLSWSVLRCIMGYSEPKIHDQIPQTTNHQWFVIFNI